MQNLLKPQRLRVVLGVYWVLLFGATHWPQMPDLKRFHTNDKQVHYLAYFVLTVLLAWWCGRRGWSLKLALGLALGIAAYGAADEILQIPCHRNCEFNDWFADMGGCLTALTLVSVWQILRERGRGKLEPSTALVDTIANPSPSMSD